MHHKRKRHRNKRAGCKMCKPWKVNGAAKWAKEGVSHSDLVRWDAAKKEAEGVDMKHPHEHDGSMTSTD